MNFRAKQRQADQFISRQDTQSAEQQVNQKEAHFQWEFSTLSDNKNENNHHKFIKLLNSLIFIETDDSIWKTWNIKIADKLNVNANYYSTEKICIVYVIFRLEDDADQQIYAKHYVDAFSLYQLLSELLKHLKEIYEDQNLIQKCHCKYIALKQLKKLFSSFYLEFTKIFSFLNYDDVTLMNNIQNKINNCLQNALSICLIKFNLLDKFKIFLQDVNKKQQVNYQLRDKQWTVKLIAASKKCFVSSSISTSVSTTNYVQFTTFFILESEWSRMSIICFNCKVLNHLSKNCSQLKTSTSTSCAFISCLNKIIMSKEEKKLFTEKSKNETKKLVTFIKNVMKDVLISSTMSSLNDFFASKSLTTECVLFSDEINYSLKSLIDIEAADYLFIDELIAQNVCDHLQIELLSLIKLKSIREFDDHYAKKLITHAIYLNLTVQDHMKRFVSMLITWLSQHQMIFEKTWMNKIEIMIDMRNNHLQFSDSKIHIDTSSVSLSVIKKILIEQKSSIFTQILKRFISSVVTQLSKKSSSFSKIMKLSNLINFASSFDSMNIAMIETAAYKSLVKWLNVTTFAIIITKIDWLLKTARNKLENVNLQELSHEEILKEVKAKLSLKYHDYLNMFDRAMTDQLFSYHLYDHKIELTDEKTSSWSCLYYMSDYKLQKMKNYLIKHLNKNFISSSLTSYASFILFIEKKDDSLRFCINYRKLNALIKRDHYSLFLIDETLACIQDSKYLTWLNIIVVFNKLRMHSKSEDLTIFIIFFDFYKYHVMSFELINDSTFYQHYINDVLFDYLHQFCQIYLDDIIIYSKTLKKHKKHVRLVLHKLREIDLQMNINKCKFHVQEISFLELLLFIKRLKMNFQKIQAVVEWFTSTNLTQMQFFIDFCNFYRRFIKNFLKIVQSIIQLT